MPLYYVETGMGCTLIEARSRAHARERALRQVGTYNGVQLVRKATPFDKAWVRGMRGEKENERL